jgi:hypothetical protein
VPDHFPDLALADVHAGDLGTEIWL